jgi:adenylate kinase
LLNRLNCRKCGATYNERFLRPRAEGICDKCGGRLYKRHDDIPEVIKKRLDIYAKQTEPLLDRYKKRNLVETVSISNAETPQTVVDKIMAIIVARTVSRQPLWASVM